MALRDTTSVRQSVRAALRSRNQAVLAVSGGLDSMVLLDAAAASVAGARLVVASFDHGTGPAAEAAVALVAHHARARGLRVETGCVAVAPGASEAEWRAARWGFLRAVAERTGGVVCTAHSRDDQLETVVMRIMRGAGARGLAGLYAVSDVVRPLLRFSRRDLVRYARAQGLTWIEDPTNDSRAFFRNRVRHDLLPALRKVRPGIEDELLRVSRRAAQWRVEVEAAAAALARLERGGESTSLDIAAQSLTSYSSASLGVLWPALAAQVGATLDRRGTERLIAFTQKGQIGSRIQLSGGWEVVRARHRFELRKRGAPMPESRSLGMVESVRWGAWSFVPTDSGAVRDSWGAWLPVDLPLSVRVWQPGEAMSLHRAGVATARKVKQLLSKAGITGYERDRWPVVLAGGEIVWIPGVCRSDAATERSGRPSLAFVCEYNRR